MCLPNWHMDFGQVCGTNWETNHCFAPAALVTQIIFSVLYNMSTKCSSHKEMKDYVHYLKLLAKVCVGNHIVYWQNTIWRRWGNNYNKMHREDIFWSLDYIRREPLFSTWKGKKKKKKLVTWAATGRKLQMELKNFAFCMETYSVYKIPCSTFPDECLGKKYSAEKGAFRIS